jgi:spore photoproduct lyase
MKAANKPLRIGTGQYSDSLALDQKTGLSKLLIKLFAGQDNHLLELKTKSAEVDHLLDLNHRGKTVFAWSVNPEKVVKREELGSVSLSERIKAAKKCTEAGYPVAFHFDPVIFYPGWDRDYKEVVDLIFSEINAKDIAWISLGALRYQPELKYITFGEMHVGEDGKMRYIKPIRIEIFKKMHEFIRNLSKDVYVYLCMEGAEVWKASGIMNQKENPICNYFKFFLK